MENKSNIAPKGQCSRIIVKMQKEIKISACRHLSDVMYLNEYAQLSKSLATLFQMFLSRLSVKIEIVFYCSL